MSRFCTALYHLFVPGTLERTIRHTLRKQANLREIADTLGLRAVIDLTNIAQFIAICILDIRMLSKQMFLSVSPWKRRLHGRHLSLALTEFHEDVPQLMGKRLRQIIAEMPGSERHLTELNLLRTDLASILKAKYEDLRAIRVMSAAHRHHDAVALLQQIDNLQVLPLFELTTEVIKWCTRTLNFLNDISTQYSQFALEELANRRLQPTRNPQRGLRG